MMKQSNLQEHRHLCGSNFIYNINKVYDIEHWLCWINGRTDLCHVSWRLNCVDGISVLYTETKKKENFKVDDKVFITVNFQVIIQSKFEAFAVVSVFKLSVIAGDRVT
jgi:hypothetical protein